MILDFALDHGPVTLVALTLLAVLAFAVARAFRGRTRRPR
jgi:hypothetical protein